MHKIVSAAMVMVLACSAVAGAAQPARPNIILFLVDDMGWMDCGAYGSQYYKTPNIDAFARRGMLFTDAYAANPLCSPTRCSIMTGKYPARHGITTASGHQPPQPPGHNFMPDSAPANRAAICPESKNYMEPAEYTLAEALRDAGYRTAHMGKWHIGLTEPYWPEQQGFELAIHGKPDPGPPSYFSPYNFKKFQSFPNGPDGEYITDRLTDEAVKFIESPSDKPFFLNLWHYAVHGPWGHKEEYTRQFAQTKDPRGVQDNPIMASMLESVDQSLGRIVATLDRLHLTDHTIILFSSDNGGNVHSNVPGDAKRGGEDSPFMKDWRKWAGNSPPTNNSPLRAGKSWLFEGGVRVPLVFVWPGHIAPASRTAALANAIDFYPTLIDLAGVPRNPQQVIDGISLAPVLLDTGKVQRDTLFNFFPHTAGNKPAGVTVRHRDFKLIRWFEPTGQFPDKFELYNLASDIGETHNLASAMPDKVAALDALIDGFLKDTHALAPIPNPAYKPRPTPKPASTDPLALWKAQGMTAEPVDHFMRLAGSNRQPFLGKAGLERIAPTGPVVVRLRIRVTSGGGGKGKVQWRTDKQETFPDTGQTVDFTIPPGDFSDVMVAVPVEGKLAHMRIYLPSPGPADVDWMQLESPDRPITRWDLGPVTK